MSDYRDGYNATVRELGVKTVYKPTSTSTIHVSPDCPALRRTTVFVEKPAAGFVDCVVCNHCNPFVTTVSVPKHGPNACSTCAGKLNEQGECEFCLRYDAVMEENPI